MNQRPVKKLLWCVESDLCKSIANLSGSGSLNSFVIRGVCRMLKDQQMPNDYED